MDAILDLMLTPEEMVARLGQRFKALRKYRKYSRAEVAARSGVSVATIERFENNKTPITVNNLINIAFVLHAEEGFKELFKKPKYRSIDDFLADDNHYE